MSSTPASQRIKANELRIGNWVYYGQSIRAITAIHDAPQRKAIGVDNIITEISVIHRIPLTREILEKAGFEKDDNGVYRDQSEPLFEMQGVELVNSGFLHIWDGSYTGRTVLSVHELQNLYFALTEKELNINL